MRPRRTGKLAAWLRGGRTASLTGLTACVLAAGFALSAPSPAHGKIELPRDTWGIPHVFSSTDAGAMYGLGYVTAQERGFQMTYHLRILQGRLAELIGDRPRGNRSETALDHDRTMRTFGWSRAAAQTATNLDAPTRALLKAYCAGVNDSFAAHQSDGSLHPLLQQLAATPERWTRADCLLSWWHVAQFLASDGTRDLLAWRDRTNPRPGQSQPPQPGPHWADDAAAVVQRGDVTDAWLKRTEAFATTHGLGGGEEGPKFSHAWVVMPSSAERSVRMLAHQSSDERGDRARLSFMRTDPSVAARRGERPWSCEYHRPGALDAPTPRGEDPPLQLTA